MEMLFHKSLGDASKFIFYIGFIKPLFWDYEFYGKGINIYSVIAKINGFYKKIICLKYH